MVTKFIHLVAWSGAAAGLLASLWTDLRHRLIPNELVGLVGGSGVLLCLLLRPGQIGLGLLVAVLLIALLGVLARFGFMGGGDVKMISAASLLFPAAQVGQFLVFIALAGGVLSGAYLLARFVLRASLMRHAADPGGLGNSQAEGWFRSECVRIAAGGPLPYALAIAGGVAVMIAGELPKCLSANSCWL